MRTTEARADAEVCTVDRAALDDALDLAVTRCGRLSDEQLSALQRRRRRMVVAIPAAAAAAAALVMIDRQVPTPAAATNHWVRSFITRPGQHGSVVLADGTTIRLNGASKLRIDYSAARRRAQLAAGQAYFDVRHEAARPFVVVAGRAEVRVLGTAFDLDLTRRQVALAVYRGAVGFDASETRRGVVVRAGYRSSLSQGTPDAPTRFDPSLPDWRQGWIDAAGMRLDELVDVLGRRRGVAIVPPAQPLAGITVAGRFRTDHPRALLGAIGDGFGFSVTQTPAGLVLTPVR